MAAASHDTAAGQVYAARELRVVESEAEQRIRSRFDGSRQDIMKRIGGQIAEAVARRDGATNEREAIEAAAVIILLTPHLPPRKP